MPAIPVLLQWLIIAFFGSDVLRKYGVNLNGSDVQSGVGGATARQAVPPTTVGATPEPAAKKPSAAQTVNDLANNPTAAFGFAAMGGVGIFLLAQARAAAHEAGSAAVDSYNEAKRVGGTMANADATTKNISRRAKN